MKMIFSLFFLFAFCNVSAQNDVKKDTSIYQIKAKLLKVETLPPDCGDIAWAVAQKFQIIESSFEPIKPGFTILLIQPCPEFLGKNYFIKNRSYYIKISQISGAPFGYTVINGYEKEKLFSFWVRNIKLSIKSN